MMCQGVRRIQKITFIVSLLLLWNGLLSTPILAEVESKVQLFYNLPPNDNPDDRGLRQHFVHEIDQAKSSILGAFYQINDPYVVDAFVRAHDRGLKVILSTDSDWVDHKEYKHQYQKLKKAGIKVIPDERTPLNHNKYCIIDRETNRARVWMGSYNITGHGAVENGDSAFLFIDREVAEYFYADFKQMIDGKFQINKGGVFLIDGDVAVVDDTQGSRGLDQKDFKDMGKKIEYPHKTIDGKKIEFYFSPLHNIQRKIVEAIYSAKESIYFSSYAMDCPMIYQAIINKARTPKLQSAFNIYPVALRQDPWENLVRTLRVGHDGEFREAFFSDEMWKQWEKEASDQIGSENEGKFYKSARFFYPAGEKGGQIEKVNVYGVLNWLGLSRGPYTEMLEKGISVRKTAFPGNLHNKFIIIDKKILILGSYNFSNSAENLNDETAVIIRDKALVHDFYESVFRPTFMNAYPEYLSSESEIEEFSYVPKKIAITEIHFTPEKEFQHSKFVEIKNYDECQSEKACDDKTIDLTGWKLWNGVIPMHENMKLRGETDALISYYNDPLGNKFELNDPVTGEFLEPELQTIRPQEYALMVGRNFDLNYIKPYLEVFEAMFEKVYHRKPKHEYEKYPKLFVSSRPSDQDVGNNLPPYQFLTLFFPDQFTVVDRFDHIFSFRDETKSSAESIEDLVAGDFKVKLTLKPGQSLERKKISFKDNVSVHTRTYDEGKNHEYWYGLDVYNKASDWEPNKNETATPGQEY